MPPHGYGHGYVYLNLVRTSVILLKIVLSTACFRIFVSRLRFFTWLEKIIAALFHDKCLFLKHRKQFILHGSIIVSYKNVFEIKMFCDYFGGQFKA